MFRVEIGSGEVTRVTPDDGAYTDLNPDPDGRYPARRGPRWTAAAPRRALI